MRKLTLLLIIIAFATANVAIADDDLIIDEVTTRIYDNILKDAQAGDTTEATAFNEKHSASYEKLVSFGILSGAAYEALTSGNKLTKAQFITMVMNCLKSVALDSPSISFHDVTINHWAYAIINSASKQGFITGSNGLFNPEDNISYAQAVSILVKVLGYDFKAKLSGDYPTGYVQTAHYLDLLKGVSVGDFSNEALKGDLYIMLVNTLESEYLMDYTGAYMDGQSTFSNDSSDSMLNRYFGIYYGKGIVNAVQNSNILTNDRFFGMNTIQIGLEEFKGVYSRFIDYLGMNVEYYYTEEENELVFVSTATDTNKVLVIESDDIEGFSNNTYNYTKDNRNNSLIARIDTGASIMYNGRLASSSIEDLYTPKNGSVTLINNDADDAYDVVIIENYIDIIVGTTIAKTQTVYDYYDKDKSVSFENELGHRHIEFLNKDGKQMYVTLLANYDVVSVKKSFDEKYIKGVVSSNRIKGIINEVSYNDVVKVVVDNVEYSLTAEAYNLSSFHLRAGNTVTLYLNAFGKAAAVEKDAVGQRTYGFVLTEGTESGIDKPAAVKMRTAAGDITVYNLSSRCEIDGEAKKESAAQLADLRRGLAIGKVCAYELNNENEIVKLDTAYLNPKYENVEHSLNITHDSLDPVPYKSDGNFNDKFFISPETVIFAIYSNETNDEDKYDILPMAALRNDGTYTISAYKDDRSFVASAITVSLSSSSTNISDMTLYIVENITSSLNEEDSDIYRLSLSDGKNRKKLDIPVERFEKLNLVLRKGDIIRLDFAGEKLIGDSIVKIYDYQNDVLTDGDAGGTNSTNNVYAIRLGYVYDKIDNYYSMYVTNDIADVENPLDNNMLICKPETTTITASIKKLGNADIDISTVSLGDLKPYMGSGNDCTRVIVRYCYRLQKQIFILD